MVFPNGKLTPEEHVARINVLTTTGRTNWLGMLAYLAFAFITVLSVQDADFFIASRQTQLPLVSVSIPTSSFFLFAPVISAALYVYVHLHIRKVTSALTEAPATISGKALERRITPWLLNDYVLRRRRDGAIDKRPMDWLANVTTVLLVWIAGPFVTAAIWIRSWPAHDVWMTLIAAVCLVLSIYAGSATAMRMRRDLRKDGEERHFSDWVRAGILFFLLFMIATQSVLKTTLGTLPDPQSRPWAEFRLTVSQDFRSWREGVDAEPEVLSAKEPTEHVVDAEAKSLCEGTIGQNTGTGEDSQVDQTEQSRSKRNWRARLSETPALMLCTLANARNALDIWQWLTELSSAQLAGEQFSALPPDQADPEAARHNFRTEWCRRHGLNADACGRTPTPGRDPYYARDARLAWCKARDIGEGNCDVTFETLEDEFSAEWESLRRATIEALPKPDLSREDLRGADLTDANLTGVRLKNTHLDGASLWFAQLERADLSDAQLQKAELWGAQMQGANLSRTQLQQADLFQAQLQGAYLWKAQLQGAVLTEAQMQGAVFEGAQMQGVNLVQAQMQGADLTNAEMQGADLWGANFQSAAWAGVTIGASPAHAADLRGGTGLSRSDLSSLVGDASTLLPERLEDGSVPFIPDCWSSEPPGWGHLVSLAETHWGSSQDVLRDEVLCDAPMKAGTPWPLDTPPPWEVEGLSLDDWLDQQPAPTELALLPKPWAKQNADRPGDQPE